MPFHRESDVLRFPEQHGCDYENDRCVGATGWFAPSGMPFTLLNFVDGWFDADVVDQNLADRWIWVGPSRLRRFERSDQA